MAQCLIAPLNWIWERPVTFAGGDWTARPLDALRNWDGFDQAISASADRSATRFTVDLAGTARFDLAALGLHNGSRTGRARARAHDGDLAARDWDFRGGSLGSGLAVARASEGRYFDRDGVMQVAAADTPRLTWLPAEQRYALLVEPGRTNLVAYSQDLDNGSYWAGGIGNDPDYAAAPDGTMTAYRLRETAINAIWSISRGFSTATLVDDEPYTLTWHVWPNGRRWVRLRYSNGGTYIWTNFDLQEGALGVESTEPVLARGIEALPGGGWRLQLTFAAGTDGSQHYIGLQILASDSDDISESHLGVAGAGVLHWGPQLEAGATPSSYIPTSGTAVARAADIVLAEGDDFAGIWSGAGGGVAVEVAVPYRPDAGDQPLLLGLGDGSFDDVIALFADEATGAAGMSVNAGAAAQASPSIAAAVTFDGAPFILAGRFAVNDFRAGADGTLSAADTSGSLPTGIDRLQLGGAGGVVVVPLLLYRAAIWAEPVSDGRLQAGTVDWDDLEAVTASTPWVDLVPTTHAPVDGFLPFGRPSADGKMPDDERDPRGLTTVMRFPVPVDASRITYEVDDVDNPEGRFRLALALAGKAERPHVNLSNGFTVTPVEEALAERSPAGGFYGQRLWQRRRIAGAFRRQPRDVALAQWLETQRRLGRTRPMLFAVLDVTDAEDPGWAIHQDRLTAWLFLEEPTPIEHETFRSFGWTFAGMEL